MRISNTDSFSTSDLVLVTGANGHIAQHIIDQLLSLPPRIRATLRSSAKIEEIYQAFEAQGFEVAELKKRLELIVISDMTPEGVFDEALRGSPPYNP